VNDAERKLKPNPPIGTSVGPFVLLTEGVWVNALHITAVAGTQNPDKCWVSTVSTGGEEDASYPLDRGEAEVLSYLYTALTEWEMEKGEQQERGRLEVLNEDSRTS
jgi:hypothetical protein